MHPIDGGRDDPVDRLRRFKQQHPDVRITPPSLEAGPYWIAEKDQEVVADAYWLEWFMDKLEKLYP